MRSTRGVAAAALALLTYPAAIAAGLAIGPSASDTAVHFVLGAAFVLLAAAMFDFGLARWITWLGAAAAGAFGGIFLLQGIADVTQLVGLRYLAFDILGHEIERILPDIAYIWFAALLLAGTSGRTRFVGWAVVPTIIGLEVAIAVGLVLGIPVPSIKLIIFLPFVWLLLEAAKRGGPVTHGRRVQRGRLSDAVSA